jgi:acyl-CoA synthetase (AMP-forming)/AMP-acid ligase II
MSSFNLADLFESVVDTVPDRTALIAGDSRLTYRQLEARANRLAHHLKKQRIQAGDKIGIYSYNRAEWVESMWACFKIRAVPININFRYVEQELLYIFDNADLVSVIYERSFSPLLQNISARLPLLKHFVVLEDGSSEDFSELNATPYEQALNQSSEARSFPARRSDDLYMLYTGGTTGMPKGTMWTHKAIFYAALQGGNPGGEPISRPDELTEIIGQSEQPFASLCPAPMMHGGGQWYCMIYQLSGNTFVLYSEHNFDADKILGIIDAEKVINLIVVGDAMARPIAEAIAETQHDISSLFVIGSGGAILSRPVKNLLRELLPNAMIFDSFGASETGAGGSVMDQGQDQAAGPVFTLTPNTSILDEELNPIPAGSISSGRLARCGHIPLGYYKDEKKTAETFQTDSRGTRWVIPGDYARVLEDGTAELLGRGSGCINSGGEKIYPEEVEATLKAHPAIFDTGVVGVPDSRYGSKVAAVIQLRAGHAIDNTEVIDFIRSKIAGYKCPREIIVVDEIPRTPAAKPDYRKIKNIAYQSLGIELD